MELPYLSHLEELRKRLIRIILANVVIFLMLLPFSDFVMSFSFMPINKTLPQNSIVFTALTEGFMTHIKISFWWAIIISFPFTIYQIWSFVEPGLYEKERMLLRLILPLMLVLFFSGVLFAWFFLIPFTVRFSYSLIWDGTEFLPRLQNCMLFTLKTVFIVGFFFQTPLIMYFLLKTEIIDRDFFVGNRTRIYVILYLTALIILPSDFVLQILIFVILFFLFEFFLFLYKIKKSGKKKKDA